MTERYALIPAKDLAQAKARLADVLPAGDRRALAVAMFRDVLAAAIACQAIDGVAVVSRDAEVLSIAEATGAEALAEPGNLNEALTSAAEQLAARGVEQLVVLAADLPLADAEAIEQVALAGADVALVPSRDGGTNALLIPLSAIAFQFGADSAARHLASAQQAGLRPLRLDVPSLALDIDTPDDLQRLQQIASSGGRAGGHTLAALRRMGLVEPARRPA